MQNLPEGRKRSLQMNRIISVCLSEASLEIRFKCNRAPVVPKVILQTFPVQGRPERGSAYTHKRLTRADQPVKPV